MNQKELFNAIDQAAQHHDLGKTLSRAQGFEAPFQTAPGERVFERLHQATQTFRNRSAHHRSNNWMERTNEGVRLLFDRLLD